MRKRILAVVTALAMVLAAMIGVAPTARAEALQKSTFALGGTGLFYMLHYVAREAGFFKQEGLDVEDVNAKTGPGQAAVIMSGYADVAPTNPALVIQELAKGADIVAIGTVYNIFPVNLVLSDAAIKRVGILDAMDTDEKVKRIRGLKIGVTTPGSGSDQLVRNLFLARGMDPDKEVSILPLGSPEGMLAALERGASDGFAWGAPHAEIATQRGLGRIVLDTFTGQVPEYRDVPYLIMATSRATLAARRPILEAAVRAYTRAIKFIHEQPDEALRITRSFYPDMDEATVGIAFKRYLAGVPTTPMVTPEQVRNTARAMSVGKTPVEANYDEVFYPDLARDAERQILGR